VPKHVVIVESPAKAKTIEKYLGKDYHVEASMGHVRDLPPKALGVDIEHDFKPTYQLLKGKEKVLGRIRKAVQGAASVTMATDLDREGEAIAWHLCEALGLEAADVQRVIFHEITRPAIAEAFAHPGRINQAKVSAQEARRILDRLVGYKLSPLLWKKVAKGLSAGRVQSVAVRLLVEREREIRAFKPEEYWKIAATLSPKGQAQTFQALLAELDGAKFRPAAGDEARRVGDALRRAAYRVLAVRRRRVQDKAPPPFITSQLQQAASTQLRFSARRTMSIAQQLYQGVELGSEGSVALITYMRTDSYHVAPQAQAAARDLIAGQFGADYLPEEPPVYRSRGRAQEAHEAIRPTDVSRTPEAVRPHLSRDDARLYELIWKRFVASQMRPAVWDVTDVDVEAAGGGVRGLLKARGRLLVRDGHTRVTGLRLAEDEQQLPALAEGDGLDLKDLKETQHFTQPPPRYTEATLVKKLESLGIGRPSTYAAIISTIQDRGYARQEQRRFFATELGEVVTDKLVDHFPKVMDVKFTSHMEDELDEVEDAGADWIGVVREFWGPFSESLERAEDNMKSTKQEPVEDAGPCPQCQAPLVKRWSKGGPFLGCSKYPECTFTRPVEGEARPEPKRTEHACERCGGAMLLRQNRRGEPFLGCENYPKCKSTLPCDAQGNPIRPTVTDLKCEKCGAAMVFKSGRRGPFFACSAYPKCRSTLPCDEQGNPVKPEPTGEVCEKCGSPMVVKNSRRGPFLACSGYPKCRNAKSLKGRKSAGAGGPGGDGDEAPASGARRAAPKAPARRRPKPAETDRECPDCGKRMVVRQGRRGPFLGCAGYPKCRHTEDLPDDLASLAGTEGA
jgi:DNA topoisomerase-1